MPSVVIAGGTSASLGKSIIEGILSLAPHWKPIVFSRPTSKIPTWLSPLLDSSRVDIRRVDYADHAALVAAIQGAHTVISVLFAADQGWYTTQRALLNASKEAGVKRFAPSEFGIGPNGTPQIDGLAGNIEVWKACEESGLEWTRFENGHFMNYLGFGVKGDLREEALGGRDHEGEFCYYVTERRAEIPLKEDGTYPRITITAMQDIGKFVARSLDLERWETTSYMVGETIGMDEVVRIAEEVMGQKWEVSTVSPTVLRERLRAEKDDMKRLWIQLALVFSHDEVGESVLEPQLNRLFPDIKPLTVEQYMRRYYSQSTVSHLSA